jgi:predicted membrane-bound spermidine synthase
MFNVDAVELDERIADVSEKYFSLSKDVNVITDDARHFIEKTNKKYDVIFFDVFRGDVPPAHVLDLECFEKTKSLLNRNGMVIVNFYGFLTGDIGKAGRSVYKTLCAAGFNTKILATNSTGPEEERNVLFLATTENKDFKTLKFPLLLNGQAVDIDTMFIKIPGINDATIFTDDKPILDLSIIKAVNNCRASYDSSYVKQFSENGIPLFE